MMTPEMINAQSTFENILSTNPIEGPITVSLGAICSDADTIQYRSLNLSDDLANAFLSFVNRKIGIFRQEYGIGNLRLLEYAAGYKPDKNEIEWIQFNDTEWLSNLLSEIPDPIDIPLVDLEEEQFLKDLRFYAISASIEGNTLCCFSFYKKMKQLSQSNKIMAFFVGDRFEMLDEIGFLFDERIDCILFGNYIFSLSKSRFHNMFRYYDQIRTNAQRTLDIIHSQIPISNFEEFQQGCMSHFQKLSKLLSISKKPYLSSLTLDDVRRTIQVHNLAIEIIQEDGQEKIRYDPRHPWIILNLFDDAYLGSEMTHLSYEVNSKRLLS